MFLFFVEEEEIMSCCVPHCQNDFKSGVRIFRFPKDENKRHQWAQVIKAEPDFQPTENSRICEVKQENLTLSSSKILIHFQAHFKASEIHTKEGKGVLKKGAMPSIFPSRNKKALIDHDYGFGNKTDIYQPDSTSYPDSDITDHDPLSLEIKHEPLDFNEEEETGAVIKQEQEDYESLEPEVVLNVKKEVMEEQELMPTIANAVSMAAPSSRKLLPLPPELKAGAPPEPMTKNPPVFTKIFLCPLCEGGKHPPQFGSLNGAQSHLWTFHRIPKRGQKLLQDAGITILEKQ